MAVYRTLSPRFAGLTLASLVGVGLAPASAQAQMARPENQVSLNASASREVPRDLLSITLSVVKTGNDSAAVQSQLKQALDAALTEAKKAAQPGAMDVRTSGFSLFPRYGSNGRINGWQGSAELVLEGKDMPRVAQTAGKLNGLAIVGTSTGLSREARDKFQGEVTALAVQNFRARAQEVAKAFGFSNYSLREVSVNNGEDMPVPMVRMSAKAGVADAMAEAPVPIEAGKANLTVTVSGSVQLMN